MIGFQLVQLRQIFPYIEQFLYESMLIFSIPKIFAWSNFLYGAKNLNNQNAVVRHQGSTAFANDVGMRHFLCVTHIRNVVHDVIGILLERVIGGTVEGRTAPIIIHTQTTAYVQEFDLE